MLKVPTAPRGLDREGKKLWRNVLSVYELRPDELSTLEDACREADLIAEMQSKLDELDSKLTTGSMGQLVAHPYVSEIRQHRAQKNRLLVSLKLPDENGRDAGAGERSSKAREAANQRWRKGA